MLIGGVSSRNHAEIAVRLPVIVYAVRETVLAPQLLANLVRVQKSRGRLEIVAVILSNVLRRLEQTGVHLRCARPLLLETSCMRRVEPMVEGGPLRHAVALRGAVVHLPRLVTARPLMSPLLLVGHREVVLDHGAAGQRGVELRHILRRVKS